MTTINLSMFDMDFADAFIRSDLVRGRNLHTKDSPPVSTAWRRFLKPGGWLVVSELTWLVPIRRPKPRNIGRAIIPAWARSSATASSSREAGYVSMDGFVLPTQDWWNNYYGPDERRVEELREKYADDPEMLATLDEASSRALISSAPITMPTATSST